jgi:hypothetical protein
VSRWLEGLQERSRPLQLQLHVGADRLSWHGATTLPEPVPLPPDALHHATTLCWAELLRALLAAAPARSGVDVCVDAAWCRFWLVQPPGGVRHLTELQQVAQARFHLVHGGEPSAWAIDADWRTDRAFVACALPEALLTALRNGCAGHLHLRRIAPETNDTMQRLPAQRSTSSTLQWTCCLGPRSVLGLVHQGHEPVHVWQRWLNEAPTPAQLADQLAHNAELLGCDPPERALLLTSRFAAPTRPPAHPQWLRCRPTPEFEAA